MNGYLVNLFKYPPADVESIRKVGALKNQIAADDYTLIRNVVWSNLDRMEVRIVNKFGDYRSADKSEKSWIGERQFAMLYDLVEESKSKLKYRQGATKEDHCRFRFEPVGILDAQQREEYRFFGISMVNFSPTMHEYFYKQKNSGTVIHQEMSKILDELCNSQTAHFLSKYLSYEIYGTLGSADCAIIWLVNQYTDVIALLEALKKIKCTEKEYVISNVYTIMGLSNPLSNKDIFKGSKGIFNLRLIRRGSFDIDSFKAELSKCISSINDINIVLGKYDVSVTFESANITDNLYADKKPIHFRSEKYYQIILEAHTELMQKSGVEIIEPIKYNTCKNITEISVISNTECFEKIKALIDEVTQNEIFVTMSYLKETLWLLYQDFIKNMASEFSYPWTIDLGYAFQKSIEYMQEILKEENGISQNEAISFIENFIDSIRQMILHISQASKLYFEIPNSHLKQTGAYSKVLSAYYGIIKELLKISYAFPKYNMQSEIIPFITFDVKPKVESVFFENLKVQEKRVVNFQMPYEALTDVSKYSKLLAHEVFHYITPERRDMRNHLYGCIIWTEIIKSICYQRFLSLYCALDKPSISYEDWHIRCGKIIRELKQDIWNIVLEQYEQLMPNYKDYEWCLWHEYYYYIDEKALMEYKIEQSCISKIYNIIKELLENNSFFKGNNDNEYQIIINTIEKDLKDNGKFISWYLSTDVLTRSGTKATDIIDAHREAFADFFMIQVMNLDVKGYLTIIFDLADIYEPDGQMQMMQMFRVGMVIDYIWGRDGNLTDESINKNIEKESLEEEQAKRLRDIWKEYKKYAMFYRKVFHYLFKSMDLNEMQESQYTELFDSLKAFQNKVVQYTLSERDKNFEDNCCIIENMQHQAPLEKIFDKKYLKNGDRRQLKTFKSEKSEFHLDEIKKCEDVIREDIYKLLPAVQSVEEFMKTFEIIAKELQENQLEPLWFRGHGSSEYKLIPSLYRMKDCNSCTYHTPLRTIMKELVTAFRVKAFHVPEIFPKGNDSILGTMVSMQHYGVETNLMDWSQQIFSALYFALEKYIDNPNEKPPEVNARVYILNPARFNIMMKNILGSSVGGEHYAIPALLQEEDKYARYFPFLPVKDDRTDGEDKNNYPFAIYTPYVNPRIKAQAGCFTIFSINAGGRNENGECSYLRFELEELQNQCQKTKNTLYKPFLGYINIDKEYVISIANNIRTMGITKQYIYPELRIIAKKMKDEIKSNYLDKNE